MTPAIDIAFPVARAYHDRARVQIGDSGQDQHLQRGDTPPGPDIPRVRENITIQERVPGVDTPVVSTVDDPKVDFVCRKVLVLQ